MSTKTLLEYVRNDRSLDVDSEKGVVRGVRVLGLESANNRVYLRDEVASAIALYEGIQVNADHPSRPGEAVSIDRRLGWLEGVHQEQDGGLRGDLYLLKTDPRTPKIIEVATRRPSLLGLSHNASGRTRHENGREIVEKIERVHSVDLVADPATVRGLHESRNTKMKISALVESLKMKRPSYSRRLMEMAEAGLMSPDMEMPSPPEESAGEGGDSEQALYDAAKAVIDDTSMDVAAKIRKIRRILSLVLSDKSNSSEKSSTESGSTSTEENRRLRLENAGLKLLMEFGIRPDKILQKALAACQDEKEIKGLLEEAKNATQDSRPRSAPVLSYAGNKPLQEAIVPNSGDGAALARWLKTPE